MVCGFCGFVEFEFTVHPIPGGGSPVLYRISTGSPAVGRVVVVKTFRIRIVSIRFTTYFLEVFENIWDKIWRN